MRCTDSYVLYLTGVTLFVLLVVLFSTTLSLKRKIIIPSTHVTSCDSLCPLPPGSDRCTKIDNPNTILTSPLKKAERHWFKLGTELDIKLHALENIEGEEKKNHYNFRAMITKWYNNNTEHCWEAIITALEAIEELDLANELGVLLLCHTQSAVSTTHFLFFLRYDICSV